MDRKEYLRAYQKKWISQRRMDWINSHGPCVDCGSWENPEVDHNDPSTKLCNPSKLWSLALDNPKRVQELAKCVVRCKDCHKLKSNSESLTANHGTYAMRNHHKCKCDDCMEYVRRIKRNSRARIRKDDGV